MDCATAQSLISDAMDREPVDPALLAEAKEHCRTCPACARFVRGQLVVKQAPAPQPPDGLIDRVMAAVRAEAQAAADQAAAAASASAAEASAAEQVAEQQDAQAGPPTTAEPEATPEAPAAPLHTLAPPKRSSIQLPRTFVIGVAAAAMLFVLVGTAAVVILGMRQMTPKLVARNSYDVVPNAAQAPAATAPAPESASSGGASDSNVATGSSATQLASKAAPQFITVSGKVYQLAGEASGVNASSIPVIGGTTSSLGDTFGAVRHDVHGATSADVVYVANNSGKVFSFKRVTRTYGSLTYVLTSADITDFGQWPALPLQITPPLGADGSPTFIYDGTDGQGVRVYRLSSSSATTGIAIAPNSDKLDVTAGDPNWTWWSVGN